MNFSLKKKIMEVQNMAKADYNAERDEVTILSKHSFCGSGKRIVGAISVLFIQSDNNYSAVETCNSDEASENKLQLEIPASLSIINLPHFSDSILHRSHLTDKSIGNIVTKKFINNLNSSAEENVDEVKHGDSESVSDKNETIKQTSDDASCVLVQQQSQTQDKEENEQTDLHLEEKKNNSNESTECTKVMIDASTNTDIPLENSLHKEEKDLKMSVDAAANVSIDASTNTDIPRENALHQEEKDLKTFVDAATNVSLVEVEMGSGIPLKRKRTASNESKETSDLSEPESASMFIITENKSSSEEDSESQDSVELENTKSDTLKEKSNIELSEQRKMEVPEVSPISEDVIAVHETSSMDTVCTSKDIDLDNEEFKNSTNVSVVDLSNIPVSYANLPSEQVIDRNNDHGESVHRASANTFSTENFSGKTNEVQRAPQSVLGNQRPKFIRSTSLSKGSNKATIEKCKICKRSVSSLADMFHHSKIHNIGIKCCVCGMKAFDWGVMKHHYTWHLQRNAFKCPQCPTTFGSRDLLAAHIKTHSTAKSLVHMKKPKLHPPASKFVLPKSEHSNLPNLSAINRQDSKPNISPFSNNKGGSSHVRRKFTPFRQHVQTPEHIFQTDQNQRRSPSNQLVGSQSGTNMINVNHILNYSCGCCEEKFVNVEKLKRHVLMYHSEQTMSDSSYSQDSQLSSSFNISRASTSNINFTNCENSSSSTAAIPYPPENSGMLQIKVEEPEIIDIEQLGKFTENLENSRSNTGSDHFTQYDNQTAEQLQQEVMQSFIEISNMDQSQTPGRQRKSACRLANVVPVCRICGIYLNSWNEILEHRFAHPDEIGQQLACTVCSSVLSTRDSLKRHAINHMGIRHQCQFCNNEYSRKDSLLNHMRSAHGYSNN
ncbi:zinc finger protein 184-like [Mytilus californianus]|uniref:zinc finger protein 184-like n=1 Tax=Mytilus californianus TaxID=6549 RepID=UPI0022480736|nr:zinc finger protein 184-like [Mytilus californianus]